MSETTTERPAFEIVRGWEHLKIYASGRVETHVFALGSEGLNLIINRIPAMIGEARAGKETVHGL